MNTSMLDFIKQQQELKERIMPKSISSLIALKRKLQPLQEASEKINNYRNIIPIVDKPLASAIKISAVTANSKITNNNFPVSWSNHKKIAGAIMNPVADYFLSAKKTMGHQSEYSKISSIANAIAASSKGESLKYLGITAAAFGVTKNKAPKSLIDIVINRANSPLNNIYKNLALAAATTPLTNVMNPLAAINKAILSEPLTTLLNNPFSRYFKTFAIPDFQELDESEEIEDDSKRIILLNHGDIPRIIKEICEDNSILYTVTPRNFEKIIAELFRFHGYKARLTKQTRDGGFDIIVEKLVDNGIPFKALIECKRNRKTNKVDVQIIRAFSSVAWSFGVKNAIVVTTSSFTKDAWLESKFMPADMSLREKKDIVRWSESYTGKTPIDNLVFSEQRTDRGIIISA